MDKLRRDFIKKAGIGTAALTVGGLAPGFTAKSYGRIVGANDRIAMAVIGINTRGNQLTEFIVKQKNAEVLYICDVDERCITKGIATVTKAGQAAPKGEKDMRIVLKDKAVDAIAVATPDHWHTPALILGCQAGKHVYVEKPLSHNPHEGELAIQAAKKYKRIVQMGNQRRSSPEVMQAIKELHEGVIGRAYLGKCWYTNKRKPIGVGKDAPVPSWLDYELWQGPTPRKPYKDNLIHYNWHWFWHWGTGEALNNGTHEMDIVRWGLAADYPTKVSSLGGRYHYSGDDWETPDTQLITINFPDRKTAMWEGRSCNGTPIEGQGSGVIFYGEKGSMQIKGLGGFRNEYAVYDENNKLIKEVKPGEADSQKGTTPDLITDVASMLHMANFLDSIREGKPSHSNAETGYKSTLLQHLGNISLRTGRTLDIDPKTGYILNDKEALKLWDRDYEKGWEPTV
jgi:predicted dehydrogenase